MRTGLLRFLYAGGQAQARPPSSHEHITHGAMRAIGAGRGRERERDRGWRSRPFSLSIFWWWQPLSPQRPCSPWLFPPPFCFPPMCFLLTVRSAHVTAAGKGVGVRRRNAAKRQRQRQSARMAEKAPKKKAPWRLFLSTRALPLVARWTLRGFAWSAGARGPLLDVPKREGRRGEREREREGEERA